VSFGAPGPAGDDDAERAESPRFGPLALALALAGVFFAVVYPWAIDFVLERLGTRATAGTLLVIAALTLIRARRPWHGRSGLHAAGHTDSTTPRAGGQGGARSALVTSFFLATLVGAALLDDRRLLRLLPAWVYLGMTLHCLDSARSGQSIIEQGVRWVIPEAPDFIRDYCRALTGLWGVFFLLAAATIAWFAFAMPPERWHVLMSRDVWFAMAGVMTLEFFVRKTWFRYYFRNGPFERFWAQLFPAEATARGRRSLEYIEAYHARIEFESSPHGGDPPR
jgi:uncharacterized membrane protein